MFLFLVLLGLTTEAHPVHVALTSVEYLESRKTFHVSFKIFRDDLERVIAAKYKTEVKLTNSDENPEEKRYLEKYIRDNFRFVVDGDTLPMKYEGKRINEMSIWIDFSVPYSKRVTKVDIYNTVMMDLFCDQTDLVIFKYGKVEKGVALHPGDHEVSFDLGS